MSGQYGKRLILCLGCSTNEVWDDQIQTVKCLGCGMKFRRCPTCYRKFAGCSDECRRLSRKALADAWVSPPPIEDKSGNG